ncbi:MAG: alpha/beta hydrolase family protein, partial [Candidatus Binatia bacterium]
MADKTLEEINSDILHRAGRINPFERVKKADVEQIVNSLTSLDNDLWGREWGKYGAKYEALGDEEEKSGRKKEAGETYYLAYEYYRIGRYPVPSSPEKMTCYRGALRTFLKAAPTMDPPLKRIEIPFEGKKVVGYLQIPPGVSRPPVVMHWGGVDGWKEDRRTNNDALLAMGLACFTIDMPGAGENPCLGNDLRAERTFSAAMDHLETRQDIDGKRIACMGGSFGGYWAAKL